MQNDSNDKNINLNNKKLDSENFVSDVQNPDIKNNLDYADLDDYIYKKPVKVRKKPTDVLQDNYEENVENTTFVASNRSSPKRSKHRKKKKKMKTWKKVLLSIGYVLPGLIVLIAGTVAVLYYNGSNQLLDGDYVITAPENVDVHNNGETVVYNGVTYKYNKNITSILMMGIDTRELDSPKTIGQAGQSDVNILLTVDTSTGKMTMINISRDIMTEVTEYSTSGVYVGMDTMQLCLAYSFGDGKETSCNNQVNAVKRIFYNVPINSYYSLDLDGIAAINDSIGGVDVVSPETVGIFEEGKTYHLEGEQAESFVRDRRHDTAEANSYRNQRQLVYINAFISKLISQTKSDISTPLNLFNTSSEYSCTNLNASKVCYLAATALTSNGMSYDTLSVPGEVKLNGDYAEFYIDETNFYEMFLSVFYQPVG